MTELDDFKKREKELEHLDGSIQAAKYQGIKAIVAVLSPKEAQRVRNSRLRKVKLLKISLGIPDKTKPVERVRMRDER